jgi:hypothetical protein
VKGGIEMGGTRHRAPTFLQDAEVVAEQLSGSLRLVCCQGNYFVERQEFDLLGHVRWVDAEVADVTEWFATFLAELRGDE